MTTATNLEAVRAALPADRYVDVHSAGKDPGYWIAGRLPAIAVRPRTAEEVASLLAAARAAGAAVAPLGTGTARSLGCPLARYDVALDMRGLDRVLEYEPADLTVTVEAGVTLRDLQVRLHEHGQYLPIDPPPGDEVTIGGLLATARSGAWRGHLPAARDLVLGLTVALPDGTLASSGGRVVKNVSGYDLHRLHTGALGALGVIVRASFKVAPLPEATDTLSVRCSNLVVAERVAFEVWDRRLPLRALSILDERTAAQLGLPPAATVLIEVAGVAAAVERASREIEVVATEQEGAQPLDLGSIVEGPGRRTFVLVDGRSRPATRTPPDWVWSSLRRHEDRDDWATYALLRLSVPPSEVRATLEAVATAGLEGWAHLAAGTVMALGEGAMPPREAPRADATETGGLPPVESTPAGRGSVRFRPHPGARMPDPRVDAPAIEALRAHASRVGGFLQVESPTAALAGAVDPFGGGDLALTRALKARFDPTGVLNPGRWGEAG